LVEQLPHCDLLRLSLSTGWFVLSARQVVVVFWLLFSFYLRQTVPAGKKLEFSIWCIFSMYPWPAGPVPDAQLRLDKKLWNSHWLTEVCPRCSTQAEPKRPPMALYLCCCPALYTNLPLWDQSELLWNDGGALLKFPIFFGQFLTDRFIAETPTPTSKKGDNSWRSNFVGSPLGEKPAN